MHERSALYFATIIWGAILDRKKERNFILTPNRQMYNASHIRYKIRAIYTHAYAWTHVHKHSSYKQNNKLIIYVGSVTSIKTILSLS